MYVVGLVWCAVKLAEPQDVPSAVIVTVSAVVGAVLRVIVPVTVPVSSVSVTDAVVVAVSVGNVSPFAPVRFGVTETL